MWVSLSDDGEEESKQPGSTKPEQIPMVSVPLQDEMEKAWDEATEERSACVAPSAKPCERAMQHHASGPSTNVIFGALAGILSKRSK